MPNKTFIEDVLTLGGDVLSHLIDARHDLKSSATKRMRSVARGLDFVSREEFDVAFAMLAKARDAQEDLSARLAKIESHFGLSGVKKTVKTQKRNLPSVKTRKKTSPRK